MKFLNKILRQAIRDTRGWIGSNFADRAIVALAALIGATLAALWFGGITQESVLLGSINGAASLATLILLRLIIFLTQAPSKVRDGRLPDLTEIFNPGTRRRDPLQHKAVHILHKVEAYLMRRKILEQGENNDASANMALGLLVSELESFGQLAQALGMDVVSRGSRREALALYEKMRLPTHETDFDFMATSIDKFAQPRLKFKTRMARLLRRMMSGVRAGEPEPQPDGTASRHRRLGP